MSYSRPIYLTIVVASVLLLIATLLVGSHCRAQVATTTPGVGTDDNPTYLVIPIRDEVGIVTTTEIVKKMLAEGDKFKPSVVILDIKSSGGQLLARDEIIDLLVKWQGRTNIRIVAYVTKNALSAAALIAMSCSEIYMAPEATIGGAKTVSLPERSRGWDIYDDPAWTVNEKLAPAPVLKAKDGKDDPAAKELGDHDPLLAEAMSSTKIELWLAKDKDGKPKVIV